MNCPLAEVQGPSQALSRHDSPAETDPRFSRDDYLVGRRKSALQSQYSSYLSSPDTNKIVCYDVRWQRNFCKYLHDKQEGAWLTLLMRLAIRWTFLVPPSIATLESIRYPTCGVRGKYTSRRSPLIASKRSGSYTKRGWAANRSASGTKSRAASISGRRCS